MKAFIIYDNGTGALTGTYTITDDSQLDRLMALNTPKDRAALEVAPFHPSKHDNAGWTVQNGVLTKKAASGQAKS